MVTILTAVYNAEATLARCLDSLLSQTCADLQVVAVDDASTDRSLSILEDYARRDDRLTVLRQTVNKGQACARNRALEVARGEWICMVDADDWLAPDALEKAMAVVQTHPDDTDAVLFRLVRVWPDGREEPYPLTLPPDLAVLPLNEVALTGLQAMELSLDWHIHGLYLVRRDIHLAYPYDDSCRLYSDDNTTRLHYLYSRRVRFSQATYYYLQNPLSTTLRVSAQYFLCLPAEEHMRHLLLTHLPSSSPSASSNPPSSPDTSSSSVSSSLVPPDTPSSSSSSARPIVNSQSSNRQSPIASYERHRWLRVIDCCYYLALHRRAFTRAERREARRLILHARASIDFAALRATDAALVRKFGYRPHLRHTFLFLLEQHLYLLLRALRWPLRRR